MATVTHRPSPGASSGRALQITPRERQVLQLLADGHTAARVAAGLGIGARELEALLAGLFAAMGTATQADAVASAHKRGLLTCEPRGDVGSPAGG